MAKKKASKKKAEAAEHSPNGVDEQTNGVEPTTDAQSNGVASIEQEIETITKEDLANNESETHPVVEVHDMLEAVNNGVTQDPSALLDTLTSGDTEAEATQTVLANHEDIEAEASIAESDRVIQDESIPKNLASDLEEMSLQKETATDNVLLEDSMGASTAQTPANLSHESTELELQELRKALQDSRDEQRATKITMEELSAKADRLIEEKTLAETQYKSLFSKVTQMKTTLGARLKQDSEELAQNRILIEDLEAQNATLSETVAHMQEQIVNSSESSSSANSELVRVKKEIENLQLEKQTLQETHEAEKKAHQEALQNSTMTAAEWENLAREERSARDNLRDRIVDLEEQLSAQNTAYDNLRGILEQDNQAIAKFKQNIYELQESHQNELRETVDTMQATISQLSNDSKSTEERATALRLEVQSLSTDLEKLRPYEQEVKEKNLLIGKLRHEAVILNEHLTKALRLLKRGSSNDSVDRQLLNNLLLSFFQIPRQDSKRFEVLKVLSSVLAWDDTQKEQAGLLRPGSTNPSLGALSPTSTRSPPMSPTINRGSMSRRTSGTLQLQAADFMGPNRESMADLWINFLQSEAAMNATEQAQASES